MSEGRELRFKLESKLSSVEVAELIVERLAQQHGFAEDLIGQLGMAERTCTANAVTHGNGYSSEELVFLSVAAEPSRFSITIKDEGDGFHPDEVPDPLDGQNLLKSSGRGLLLMRSFVDEVSIHRGDPGGTEVMMIRIISSRATRSRK